MCLILIALNAHRNYKLVVAANRDEFYDRPTLQANYWEESPFLLSGKDISAGGTWMGVTKLGRFCAITNYRDLNSINPTAPSRGEIVHAFLTSQKPKSEFDEFLLLESHNYNGFNLIYGSINELYYFSNQSNRIDKLNNGIYTLSNHHLDTPWFKNQKSKLRFEEILMAEQISIDEMFEMLQDEERAPIELLPDTGVGLEYEKLLSPIFIKSEKYGTRSSTVLTVTNKNEISMTEITYDKGIESARVSFSFVIE